MGEWTETLLSPFYFLLQPEKRIYWLYLLSSVLIGIHIGGKQLFRFSLWFNQSSKIDVCWLFINQWLFKLLVVPLLALHVSYALSVNQFLLGMFGSGNYWSIEQTYVMLLFTFSLFICQDFAKFLIHLTLHKVPILWRFHAVHHSATSMTPLTLYRIHPVEMCINALRSLCVGATVSGVFLYLFQNQLGVTHILGLNIFVFVFNIGASNLRHSPVWLGFKKLEYFLISPAQHQLHHSSDVQHFDKNFGSALSIWDLLFGCLLLSQNQHIKGFGLDDKATNHQTVDAQWLGIRKQKI
jgi:sterol desaturase/sphingolipid hydroxylase (fatty acid hydroxylase superfamily)